MKFRPDIATLRAIAVILVVLYHALPNAVPNGFIGVDIFFVISGFLMTNIITTQCDKGTFKLLSFCDKGTFKLLSFYGSRARRILPALIICVIIVYILAFYSGIFSHAFEVLRRTARSALLGISNF